MNLLYFQIPDTNPATDGIKSATLKVHGTNAPADLKTLRKLLYLSASADDIEVYGRLTDLQRSHGFLSDGVVGPFMWRANQRSQVLQ